MKSLFECELEYLSNPHLMHIYSGFFELKKKGVIDLKVIFKKSNKETTGLTNATINKKYKVIYDASDGYIWLNGKSIQENLEYFQNNYSVDFYFKRSYHKELLQYNSVGRKIFPLGLNYNVHPDSNLFFLNETLPDKIKYALKTNKYLKSIFKKKFFYARDFEYYPVKYKEDKILFLTRVWNPAEARAEHSRPHREMLNAIRADCIKACRKEYGKIFTGGLLKEDYAIKYYSSLIAPVHLTSKRSFLQSVKEHSICIATTGLHDSTGWKLGEYVAASRAIISEPLKYEVPGIFLKDNNYLEFENPDQLLQQIELLLKNKDLTFRIMQNNFHYYNNYLKPENLVLNTLLTIMKYSSNG
ncbi:MAG: hypothetical protein ABJA71_02260 [Ginsengibacter sp.]